MKSIYKKLLEIGNFLLQNYEVWFGEITVTFKVQNNTITHVELNRLDKKRVIDIKKGE